MVCFPCKIPTFSIRKKKPSDPSAISQTPNTITESSGMEAEPQPTWEELMGSNNWEGLLDPLNIHLRKLILRCGDFCQATYDAFNNDENSKYCGSSRYGMRSFFQKVVLPEAELYQVSAFLYGTAKVSGAEAFFMHSQSMEAWDRESNWIGYVAVTTDEATKALGRREIYVAWRGTTRNYEWINVLGAELTSIRPLLKSSAPETSNGHKVKETGEASSSSDEDEAEKKAKVMLGWLTIYISDNQESRFTKTSARTQLQATIKQLMERYKDDKLSITFCGHSLGASLSIVSAFDLVESGIASDIPVSAFVVGCPQIGNKAFDKKLKAFPNLKILHVRNTIDVIPHYPGKLLGYVDSGIELLVDSRKSTYLKESNNPSDWHNLQAILNVVAGWNGDKGKFKLQVKRSLAIINKSSECLKDEYMVPGSWWVEKNKGMALDDDGEWKLIPPADEDLPDQNI